MIMTVQMSRSEQKRRIKQLEKLVAELSSLPSSQIDRLPCPGEIKSLFHGVEGLKGGTRNRHIKYITKKLKDEPFEELYTFLTRQKGAELQNRKDFHEIEYLRDALLNEAIEQHREARHDQRELEEDWPSEIAEKICSVYPDLDKILLTRLARLYARTRNRKHSRELFRILRSAQENERILNK